MRFCSLAEANCMRASKKRMANIGNLLGLAEASLSNTRVR
jgi:hypothetical protein